MDEIPAQTYTGSAITPEPLVLAGSLSLTEGDDYEYSYENNIDVGTAKVLVTFKGDYASLGTAEKTFIINPIVVTFNANGHGSAPASQSFTALNGTVSQPEAPTEEGYTFGGWYTDSDCTHEYDFDSEISGGLTLYAKWTPTTYTITYSGIEDVTFETANPTSYTIESDSFTLNNPIKDGYTFAGWTGTGLTEATLTAIIPAGSTGSRSYTATWTKKGFTPHDENTPEFAYHSLILSGQIGVIFHVYVPEGADEGDYAMYFDVSGDKSQNTQPVSPFERITEDGNTFFGFKC